MKLSKFKPTIFTILLPILIIYLIWIANNDNSNQGGIMYALLLIPIIAFLIVNIIFLIFIKDRWIIYTIELIIILIVAFISIFVLYY